ncbi:MAG: hypothetical protein KIT73_03490 [Burkholderiales bacterium]|nr:hypothetical protein [Burkholderiales bacterium]
MGPCRDEHLDAGQRRGSATPNDGNRLRCESQKLQRNWNDRAAARNQQRLWDVYGGNQTAPGTAPSPPCTAANGCLGQQQQRYEWEKQIDRQINRQ